MSLIRATVLKMIRKSKLVSKFASLYGLSTKDSYLSQLGWFNTFWKTSALDKNGEPIPWFTYPAIDFLSSRITSQMRIFEFGSGNSTLWWSKRASSVVSLENSKEWYEKLSKHLPSNVEYKYCAFEMNDKYSKTIQYYSNKFDVIVIDGRDRVNCAVNSIVALNKGGIIIWDNADRERYSNGIKFLLDNGFKKLDFFGMTPITVISSLTSIFYKENNCLGI